VFQSFSEAPLTKHAHCGGKLAKVLSPAGIVLKGSGFYKTDSRSGNGSSKPKRRDKESAGSGSQGSEKTSDSSGSSSGDSSGSKPEAKTA